MQRYLVIEQIIDSFDGDAPARIGVGLVLGSIIAVLAASCFGPAALEKRIFGRSGIIGVLMG